MIPIRESQVLLILRVRSNGVFILTVLTEATVEDAALAWLENLGWTIAHGPGIAPGAATEERTDYGQVVLEQRLRDALALG